MAEESPSIGRRRFQSWFLGTTGGAFLVSVLYPILRYVSPPRIPEASTSEVEVGPVNDPELVEKGFKIVHFGADPVIVVKLSDTDLRAFSASCTHLDCIVEVGGTELRASAHPTAELRREQRVWVELPPEHCLAIPDDGWRPRALTRTFDEDEG